MSSFIFYRTAVQFVHLSMTDRAIYYMYVTFYWAIQYTDYRVQYTRTHIPVNGVWLI